MCSRVLAYLAIAPLALAQVPPPQINGVVNAGNFRQPAAPGALISIFGSNLATGQSQATTVPLPAILLSTMVYIDGTAAPLSYVSPGQINAQVPYSIITNTSATVQVQVDGVNSSNSPLTIVALAPAIFSQAGTGVGLGAILNQNNTLNTEASPAQPGQIIQIFATGLGATMPAVGTGDPGNAQPLAQTPSVTIGGQTATVAFAGAAPGFAGLDQVNAMVPNVGSGDQPILISFPGAQSAANVTVAITAGSADPPAISSTYFGMHLAPAFFKGTLPWPSIPFGTLRLLGDTVTWADIEPSQGSFNFTLLDSILAAGAAHGITDFLNTLVKTPAWASSNTTDPTCSDPLNRPGGCYPPKDLNADGTGPDQYWKDFVTAIVQHVCTPGPCKIENWEVWNEPNAPNFWKGTTAQLVRLTQDAYQIIKAINPKLTVTSPPAAGGGDPNSNAASFLQSFLAAGGGQSVDVIGFHGYLLASQSAADQAELLSTGLADLLQVRTAQGLANKPVWDTEGSWGLSTDLPDPDLEASFVARYYLLQASSVQRFYWYAYDYPTGMLFDPTTMTLLEPGIAYGQVYNWMVGATPTGACTASATLYTCGFTRPGGYRALAVWDPSLTCSNGVCTTASYIAAAGYTQYRDLTGKVTPISPNVPIPIGVKPLWLENQNP
jgi:uncharacterized protein (TIGR03437 family)